MQPLVVSRSATAGRRGADAASADRRRAARCVVLECWGVFDSCLKSVVGKRKGNVAAQPLLLRMAEKAKEKAASKK
jgi:hypothetical protein